MGEFALYGDVPPRDTLRMTTSPGAHDAPPLPGARPVRAPRGAEISCRGWQQEAVLRMLMNNLDPEVAENPDALVVYGGTGRAARSWGAFDTIVRELRALADDETLLVQSGKPVGVFRTNPWAPRVLIANSNLVGKWATWEHFRELERAGLMMYGQMTAGSWIYIGTQGILQGTYETFAELARQHFGGTLRGRVVLTAGLGGMGGAQPLSVTMNDGVVIAIEVDEARARRRREIGYVDRLTESPDAALAMARLAAAHGEPLSIALVGNAAEIEPAWAKKGEPFDAVTDQTSAHDALGGYVPPEMTLGDALILRRNQPEVYQRRAMEGMADHVRAMLAFQERGAIVFDYGNNIRAQAQQAGVANAFDFAGFVPALHPAPVLRGPWAVPLGGAVGRPGRHPAHGHGDPAPLPRRRRPAALDRDGPCEGALPGAPGADLLARLRRAGEGRARLQRAGSIGRCQAPIVIGRDHLDSGSVASPNRETEAMADGSDAVADWPLLNALVNTAAGATWVSIHHGGGTGIGYSQHAGMVVVADGTDLAAQKLERVLTSDPGMGVIRHADAGYDHALDIARERGVRIPMRDGGG